MPYKTLNSDKLLFIEEKRDTVTAPRERFRKKKVVRQLKKPRRTQAAAPREDRQYPRMLRVMRIRRLVMAALRVWELKHGIREPRWFDFDQELLQPIDDF